MTTVTKSILVVASAGPGSTNPIPTELAEYCAALGDAAPTFGVRTDQRGADLGQLNLAANMKALQVDAEEYGVSVDWKPVMFHAFGSENNGEWDPDINVRGTIYSATVDGIEYFICVRLDG
ncbi:MAG: hypothetical protein GC161_13145 [Planctomycetaceae bacterium]|nr:hypothetical protein [Planctomycetaceae bacterium]